MITGGMAQAEVYKKSPPNVPEIFVVAVKEYKFWEG
jgi:hypothetical protein